MISLLKKNDNGNERLKIWFKEHGWYPAHITTDEGDIGLEWADGDSRLTVFIGPEGIDVLISDDDDVDELVTRGETSIKYE